MLKSPVDDCQAVIKKMENNNDFNYQQLVSTLLNSDTVSEPTRKALQKRIEIAKGINHFFSDELFEVLTLVCDRLMDQDPENRVVNVAIFIDERLKANTCDGWRYSDMPPDDEMLVKGLEGINETAILFFKKKFTDLKKEEQISILKKIQQGSAAGNTWKKLPPEKFFEELLAEAVEIFYSFPAVQVSIDYAGMADAASPPGEGN